MFPLLCAIVQLNFLCPPPGPRPSPALCLVSRNSCSLVLSEVQGSRIPAVDGICCVRGCVRINTQTHTHAIYSLSFPCVRVWLWALFNVHFLILMRNECARV